ncbi:Ldh family oxidoreductase [bacterium]|nr:Ldh family oxidoreductase [bacterium]
MPNFTEAEIVAATSKIIKAAGTSAENSRLVAKLLAEANATGHDSHGVIRIPQYLDSVENGDIVTDAEVTTVVENPITAIVDGNWGFGQVTMTRAVEVGLEKARKNGLAAVAVRQANHIGRLGSYVDHIAQEGMIGLLFVNAVGTPGYRMAPWGGTEPRLVTDPVAFGIPHSSGLSIVMDMTTTVVAEGKVRVKRNREESTPDGWLLDADGKPTNDPNKLYAEPPGSILPLGGMTAGHKGYGLNVAIELLAGVLSGNGCIGKDQRLSNGVMMIILDIAQFLTIEEFYKESDTFIAHVKSSPPAEGFDEILLPGEIEAKVRAQREKDGIFIEDETWGQICDWSKKLSVNLKS